ncbi:MAG: hypothetical protein IKS41_03115 [Alphaproteobacteria bacterium]|nr:hypothetical protein [Alphaproteobacteria bacterium]
MKFQKIINYFIIAIIIYFPLGVLSQPLEDPPFPILIAHGGGGYKGQKVLNSKEAVLNSIKNGFKYIELDLQETTDHDIVAAHDWKRFHELTDCSSCEGAISSEEARKRKILGNQTVLTSKEINDIFMRDDVHLVSGRSLSKVAKDKIALAIRERSIGNLGGDSRWITTNSLPNFQHLNTKKKVFVVHINQLEKNYGEYASLPLFVFGTNDIAKIKSYPFVKGWYVDFIGPKDISE